MYFKINLHNKKREAVSTADKPWLGKRVKGKNGREIWNKDPAYSNDLTRPVWTYFKYDHPEYRISSGWSIDGTLVISEITNPKYKEEKDFGKMWYDSDADLLRIEFNNGKKFKFPTDAELETLTSCIIDNKPSAPTESIKESYYSVGNRDGRKYAPMKTQESFPNRVAFLSYKKGYNEALDGIYEADDSTLTGNMAYLNEAFNPKTVKIGNQVWMSENLAIDDGGDGIYYNSRNNEYYYTWDAAVRISKSIPGWHLPSKAEFETLFKNVGGKDVAGLALKSASGWKADGNGEDSFGFSALPAGGRNDSGNYNGAGSVAGLWSSTENNGIQVYHMVLDFRLDSASLTDFYGFKDLGFSVRLIKD